MIPNGAHLTVLWVDTNLLMPKVEDEPFMDLEQVKVYTDRLRANPDAHTPLVEVEPSGDGHYLIRNGRHRWMAHVAACRPVTRVLCIEQVD